jgi:hypothetical protein
MRTVLLMLVEMLMLPVAAPAQTGIVPPKRSVSWRAKRSPTTRAHLEPA